MLLRRNFLNPSSLNPMGVHCILFVRVCSLIPPYLYKKYTKRTVLSKSATPGAGVGGGRDVG